MKKRILLPLLCILIAALAACAGACATANSKIDMSKINPDTDLLIVLDGSGKYGFIDKAGNIVIRPQFLLALPFSDGLASVVTKDCHGYIDKTGKLVLKTTYDACWPFINEHAVFGVGKGDQLRYGVIDKTGKVVVPPIYIKIGQESDGLMAFRDENDKCGYFDATGSIIIQPVYTDADSFYSGKAFVRDASSGLWEAIDKLGKYVEGYQAPDYLGNMDYQMVDDGRTGDASRLSEGLRAEKDENGLWGYLDDKGKAVIPYSVDTYAAGVFKNGVARVGNGWDWLLDLQRDDRDKIAMSEDAISINYIDRTGTYLWQQKRNFWLDLSPSSLMIPVIVTAVLVIFVAMILKDWNEKPKTSIS